LAVAAVAVAIAAATAQATPNKPYLANVHQKLNTPGSFTLTLTNDPKASQTLGSANFTPPAGFVVSPNVGTIGGSDAAGFNVNVVGNVVQFRAISSGTALQAGATVSADVTVTSGIAGCGSATWAVEAKQSNAFSGTPGNDLQLNPASDLTPLGSLVFAAPIESGPPAYAVEVPQIVSGAVEPVSVNAYDTCGNPDLDYSGATFNTEPGMGLDQSDFSQPTWSTVGGLRVGSGSLTPKAVETGDQFTVNDGPSGISATSYSTGNQPTFDVVQTICAQPGTVCNWKDPGNSGINATSKVPNGAPGNASLGLGYRGFANGVTCTPTGGAPLSPIPGTDSIQIDPYAYGGNPYTIVITYAKSLVGNGPASNFIACKSIDVGAQLINWTPLQACSNTVTVDCVSVTKVSGGAIQVTLNLRPGDPGSGGFRGG
jgi:hypothetical protein